MSRLVLHARRGECWRGWTRRPPLNLLLLYDHVSFDLMLCHHVNFLLLDHDSLLIRPSLTGLLVLLLTDDVTDVVAGGPAVRVSVQMLLQVMSARELLMTTSAEADQVSRPVLAIQNAALLPHVLAEHPEVVGVQELAPGAGEPPHVGRPGHQVAASDLVPELRPGYSQSEEVGDHTPDVQEAGVGGEADGEHAVPVLDQVLAPLPRSVGVVGAAHRALLVTSYPGLRGHTGTEELCVICHGVG